MNNTQLQFQIKALENEINNCINMLYCNQCTISRNIILSRLKNNFAVLKYYTGLFLCLPKTKINEGVNIQQRNFTLEELSKNNGKNGNPAYVAVNGIVYDVTNNAAWAAATHFGLSAGNDLTSQFASCHRNSQILNRLIEVGRLIN